jgi:hypothetical protein
MGNPPAQPTPEPPPVPPKLTFVERRRKQITRWYRKFFVEEAHIPDDIQNICDRYGEQVINSLFFLNAEPFSLELKKLISTPQNREDARAWLAETNAYNARRDHWISLRDFIMEAIIIGLIISEIHGANKQETRQAQNFTSQQTIQASNFTRQQSLLSHLDDSSRKTAETLGLLKDTTEKMNEAVNRGAKASESSAKTSSQVLYLSERAYVACIVTMPDPIKTGEKLRYVATITNGGKGLATDVITKSIMVLVPKGTSEETAHVAAVNYSLKTPPSTAMLVANQPLQQIVEIDSPLTDSQAAGISDGNIIGFAFVETTYKDLFSRNHHTNLCVYYYPTTKQIANCNSFNKAD